MFIILGSTYFLKINLFSYIFGESVSWHSPFGNVVRQYVLKPPMTAIPFLGIYLRGMSVMSIKATYKNVYYSLIRNSQNWDQTKCPSIGEWINCGHMSGGR